MYAADVRWLFCTVFDVVLCINQHWLIRASGGGGGGGSACPPYLRIKISILRAAVVALCALNYDKLLKEDNFLLT